MNFLVLPHVRDSSKLVSASVHVTGRLPLKLRFTLPVLTAVRQLLLWVAPERGAGLGPQRPLACLEKGQREGSALPWSPCGGAWLSTASADQPP